MLRVDGHTDRVPIRNARYASNWELSTARAVEVVRFLIDQGIPPRRLVAAGFGERRRRNPPDHPHGMSLRLSAKQLLVSEDDLMDDLCLPPQDNL